MPLTQYSTMFTLGMWFFVFLLMRNQIWSLLKSLRSYLRSLVQDSYTFHRLLLILLVGGSLRILTIGSNLHPTYEEVVAYYLDDANATRTAVQMVRGQTLNPHWFQHPSLSYYLNAFFFGFFVFGGYSDYRIFFIIARSINFVCSICTILVVFQLGKEIRDKSAGLISAFFLAINPLDIHYSLTEIRWEYNRATLLTSIAILYFVRALKEGKRKDFFLAASFSGLAITTLYQAGLLVIFIPTVFFLVKFKGSRLDQLTTKRRLTWRDSVYALVLMITTFLVVSPFVILSFKEFRNGLGDVLKINTGTLSLASIDPIYSMRWFDYAIFPLTPLFVLSLFSVLLFVVMTRDQKEKKIDSSVLVPLIWVISFFAIVVFIFIKQERVWHYLLILPSLSLSIGIFFAELLDVSKAKVHPYLFRLCRYAGLITILGIGILSCTTALGQQLSTFHDTRTAAANWAKDNLEPGSTIICTMYTYVSPDLFDVLLLEWVDLLALDTQNKQYNYIFLSSRLYLENEYINKVFNMILENLDYIKIKEFCVDPQYIGYYETSKNSHGFFGISWIIAALTTDDLMYGYDILVYEKI